MVVERRTRSSRAIEITNGIMLNCAEMSWNLRRKAEVERDVARAATNEGTL